MKFLSFEINAKTKFIQASLLTGFLSLSVIKIVPGAANILHCILHNSWDFLASPLFNPTLPSKMRTFILKNCGKMITLIEEIGYPGKR